MARSPSPTISRPTALQPVAAPVSTYVRPADPAPSNLHELARSLAAFDGKLAGWLQKRQAEQDKADAIRGEAAFNRNNQEGWANAVATGQVPAHASPIFVEGYKNAEGTKLGIRIAEKYSQSYATWEGRNSDDPEAFDNWYTQFIASELAGIEDPDILAGVNPHIEALTNRAYSQYSSDRANTIYSGHIATRAGIVGDIIDHASIQGVALETGTDYEAVWADIVQQRGEALGSGIAAADFDKNIVATIAAKAIEHGDPELLELLERTLPGHDLKLSSFPEYRDVKATTIAALETEARRRMTDEDKRQRDADKAAEGAIVRDVLTAIAEDPFAEIPEEVIAQWSIYDPEARVKLATARKTLQDANTMEDPQALIAVERAIQSGATMKEVLDILGQGVALRPETVRTVLDRVTRRQDAIASDILTAPSSKRFLSTIKERTTPDKVGAMFAPDGLTDEGIEATRDFEEMLLGFALANPNASPVERERAIQEIGELVLKRIEWEGREHDPQYISQADADRMRAEASGANPPEANPVAQPQAQPPQAQAQPQVQPQAPQQQPTYDEETVRVYGGDRPPLFDSLPETSRLMIRQRAQDLNMTPQEYAVEVWKTIRQGLGMPAEFQPNAIINGVEDPGIPNPEAYQRADGQPQADAGSQLTSGRTASPAPDVQKVSSILDLIGDTEGTDKRRGYNETLAYGRLTGGDVELTSMTLDQVDALQTAMLQHPENKWNSSALGRYQIIRTTLRGLRKEMGLTGNELFTPELQDRMALALLERRGLSKWMDGNMSDTKFLAGLSAEWASLPKADGKGTYEGQRIGTDANGVLMALAPIKGGIQNSALDAINAAATVSPDIAKVYANIPQKERDQFLQWNNDPIGNHEKNLEAVDQRLAAVVRRAQEIAGVQFVVGSGTRDEDMQRKAVQWGWSKTMESDHLHGGALDLWPIINGSVKFDRNAQLEIVRAMRLAAQEMGISLDIGADWKSFQDLPHFGIKA